MASYKKRIIASITILLFVVVVSLTFYGVVTDRKLLRTQMEDNGFYLVENLAHNSETGVFAESDSFLQTPISAILDESNAIWAAVYNLEGEIIAFKSKSNFDMPPVQNNINELVQEWGKNKNNIRPVEFEKFKTLDFYYPIYLRINNEYSEELETVTLVSEKDEVIGVARVGMSLEKLNSRTGEVLRTALFMMLGYLILGFFIIVFVEKAISKPLHSLSCAAQKIGEGNLDTIISVNSEDEIGSLAETFNQMVASLKNAEEDRNLLSSAVEQAEEVIVIMATDGTIQYANPAVEKITDLKFTELIGKNAFLVDREIKGTESIDDIQKSITSGEVWTGQCAYKKTEGSRCDLVETISPVRDKSGNIKFFLAVGKDITTQLKLEQDLRHAQTMEAIGILAGGIAHDFNNILGAIIGYTELSMYDDCSGSQKNDNFNNVLKAANRAKDLVKQILAFSRQTEDEMKPIKTGPIVKEVIKFMRASFPATIEISSEVER